MLPMSEAVKTGLCSFLPLAVALAGCATRARLPAAASLNERAFYDACAGSSADAAGAASLHCACAARVFHERWPGEQPAPVVDEQPPPADQSGAAADCLYSKDGVLVSCRESWQARLHATPGQAPAPRASAVDVGRESGVACRAFVDATVNQCMVSLTAVEPGERADACDCVLRSLAEEFSPAELVTMGRNQLAAVPNAQGRIDAAYGRCVPSSSDSSDDWTLALSITSAILSAGALAMGIASATSTPDTTYFFLPSN